MQRRESEIGPRIRILRKLCGISARKLSRATGVSHGVVAHIERGAIRLPNAELALRLAKALGTTPAYLVMGEGDPPTPEDVRRAIDAVVPLCPPEAPASDPSVTSVPDANLTTGGADDQQK